MGLVWYRQDRAAVLAALRRGERPDLATTRSSGPLDELVALQLELGIWEALDEVEVQRTRAGLPDALLLRTLATLPFVREASLSGAAGALFGNRRSCCNWGGPRRRCGLGAIGGTATRPGGSRSRCPVMKIPCGTRCGG